MTTKKNATKPDAIVRASVEVLHPAMPLPDIGQLGPELQLLVQQEVAKIITARNDFPLEPWFRTRQVAYEIMRLKTVPERNSSGLWFEKYGCLRCKRTDRTHYGNSMCHPCRTSYARERLELEEADRIERGDNDAESVRLFRAINRTIKSRLNPPTHHAAECLACGRGLGFTTTDKRRIGKCDACKELTQSRKRLSPSR